MQEGESERDRRGEDWRIWRGARFLVAAGAGRSVKAGWKEGRRAERSSRVLGFGGGNAGRASWLALRGLLCSEMRCMEPTLRERPAFAEHWGLPALPLWQAGPASLPAALGAEPTLDSVRGGH